MNMLFSKVLGENEKCLLFLLKKPKALFGPLNTLLVGLSNGTRTLGVPLLKRFLIKSHFLYDQRKEPG